MREEDPDEVELAIRRILLLHSVILSIGGIPLLYLGDEVGTLNDYGYSSVPALASDSRWVHRPVLIWERVERQRNPLTVEGQIYGGLCRLIAARQGCRAFRDAGAEIVELGNDHVFAYVRQGAGARVLVLANFTEQEQVVDRNQLRIHGPGYEYTDLVTGDRVAADQDLVQTPYQFAWLLPGTSTVQ